MSELTAIDAATHRYIENNPNLVDMVFQGTPGANLMKQVCRADYTGGRLIENNFWYRGANGGAYAPGEDFNISEPQVEQGLQFNPKYIYTNVTLTKEEVQVVNAGPAQAFSLLESRVKNAYTTMGAFMDISMWLNGQAATYTKNVNGFAEVFNDGSVASWDGNTYSTYGTITRGGAVGTTLNSTPVNINGAIEVTTLEENFGNASLGPGMDPTHILTSYKGYSYLKEKFLAQQIFMNTTEMNAGFTSMKYDVANVMRDRYVPGTFISGTADPNCVAYITQTTGGASTAYPTITSETMWIMQFRRPFINMYMTTNPEYQMGFTGFKPAQGNTKIVGQVLLAWQITAAPRNGVQLYGITG